VDVGEKHLPEGGRFPAKRGCPDKSAELHCGLTGGRPLEAKIAARRLPGARVTTTRQFRQ